jgi:hypothetical protein
MRPGRERQRLPAPTSAPAQIACSWRITPATRCAHDARRVRGRVQQLSTTDPRNRSHADREV